MKKKQIDLPASISGKLKSKLLKTTSKSKWIAFLILITGLLITVTASRNTLRNAENKANEEFSSVCNDIKTKITTRLHAHAQLLRSGSAFISMSDTITRREWKGFIENLKIENNLPGILGVGYAMIIPKSELSQHNKWIQREGFPDYNVRPVGEREIYTSIIYLEPFTGRNLRAFGYDMFSESVRRKAMELSRDKDVAMLSGKVILVQENDKDIQTGTLMYVPVYRNGIAVNTVEERRAAIRGWVYSPYRMNDLMQGILGRWDKIQEERIRLQIYDDSLDVSSLMFDSQNKDSLKSDNSTSRTLTIPVEFKGKKWVLLFNQHNGQISYFQGKVLIVLISGFVISLLMFLLSISLFNTLNRSQILARKLTVKLKESEEKYHNDFDLLHSIFESPTNIVIFSVDRNYCYTAFTKFHEKIMKMIWGVDIKIGMNILDVISNQKDREKAKINFDRALQGDYFILTEEYGDASLLRTFYEDHYSSVKNSEGLIVGVSVFVIDITERKQSEIKLQNSTLRLENIIQATNVGTWEWNVQTGETIFNEEWAKIIGYSIEELAPVSIKTWKSFAHPDDMKLSEDLLDDHFSGKKPYYDCECRMKHKDGHWVWIHDRGKIITRTNDGKPLMMFGTHTDISKRKEAEKKMQESEEKYRTVFTIEQDALFLIDKETLAILDVNDAACTLYGYSREEILKLKNTDISAEPEKTKLLTKQFIERIELRYHKKKDGTIFPVDISSSKFKHRNREVILAAVRDITNRVQSDLHIKEINEKLSKLNSEKDKFFTIIAHDLKSPFNSIMGFSELLVEQVNAKDYDGIEKYAEIIQYSSGRALDLLMNLMEWSQSQTGRMEFNPEYFELHELIKETELLLNGAIEQKSIVISKIITTNLPVFADKQMISTVLRNLISNAIKFTHPEGKISISVEEKPDELLVSVSDTGVGISRDNIEKLFNIGETYSTSGTRNETGTGLGLILCKEFVEKHKGKIGVDSEEGKGSTFYFTLPMNIS